MKKAGIIITIVGILVLVFMAFDLFGDKNLPLPITITGLVLSVISTFLGPAIFVLQNYQLTIKPIAKRVLIVSLFLFFIGSICVCFHLPGARIEIIFGVLIFCFFYGPLAFKNKYEKWKIYTRSNRDAFFLSLFDFLGVTMLVLGILFEIQDWPLAQAMTIIGLFVLSIGMVAWNQKFKKEVVFRKETEDKLKESFAQIEIQHQKLEEKQKEIIDSIQYAKRIQNSLLPTEKYIDTSIKRLKK